jgi:hypothetical protein
VICIADESLISGIAVDPAVVEDESNVIPHYLEGIRWWSPSVLQPDLKGRVFE